MRPHLRDLLLPCMVGWLASAAWSGCTSPAPRPTQPVQALPPASPPVRAVDEPVAPVAAALPPVDPPPRPAGVLYRDELERATDGGKAAYLLYALQPQVVRQNGRFAGWQVTQIFPSDPTLCQPCDLHVGDVIQKVNGKPLERPEELSELLASLSTTHELCAQVLRNGQVMHLAYRVSERSQAIEPAANPPCSPPVTKRKPARKR